MSSSRVDSRVCAVIVGLSIETTLAVFQQTILPGILLLVETQKAPRTKSFREKLASELGQISDSVPPVSVHVVHAPNAPNFGTAIREALALHPLSENSKDQLWLWTLHDDSVPALDALEELLAIAERGGSTTVVAPKQMSASEPGKILELGIHATRSGLRANLVEPEEIDQGQYDKLTDVLAAGTAGLLIRSDVWQLTGGFDPRLGAFGDGLEFGRRVRRAGYRVVVAPKAKVKHERRSLGSNQDELHSSWQERRVAQLYNWLATVHSWAIPLILLWLMVWTPLRMIGRLTSRHLDLAEAEWHAYEDLWRLLPAIFQTRKAIRQVATVSARQLRPLELSLWEYWRASAKNRKIERRQRRSRVPLDEAAETALRRHQVRNRAYLLGLVAICLLLTVFAWYPFSSTLAGGAWASLPASWPELLSQAWTNWISAADGAEGMVNPLLRPLSVLAAPFALVGISPANLAPWLLYLALPFGALAGWGLASLVTSQPFAKLTAGFLWVGNPGFLAVLRAGDLSGVAIWLALPLLVVGIVRCYLGANSVKAIGILVLRARQSSDPVSWAALASCGLFFAGLPAPILVLVAVIVGIGFASGLGRQFRARTRWLLLTLIVLPTAITNAPVWGQLIEAWVSGSSWSESLNLLFHPALILNGGTASTLYGTDATWLLALEVAGGVCLALLAIGGIFAVVKSWQGRPFLAITSLSAAGLGTVAYVLLRELVTDLALTALAALVVAGLVIAAAAAAPSIVQAERIESRAFSRIFAPVSSLGSLLGVAAVVATLFLPNVIDSGSSNEAEQAQMQPEGTSPGSSSSATSINTSASASASTSSATNSARMHVVSETQPLISQVAQSSERRSRLLTLNVMDDVVQAEVFRASGRQQVDLSVSIGQDSSTRATNSLAEAIATMTVTASTEVANTLAYHGIDLVLLRADSEELEELQRILDASTGLERIGTTELGTMWRVRPNGLVPARAYLLEAGGTLTSISATASAIAERITVEEDSILLLAEGTSSNWHATFAGAALEAVDAPSSVGGWQQAFSIPTGTGELSVHYYAPWQPWWVGFTVVALVVLGIALVPRRLRTETVIVEEAA